MTFIKYSVEFSMRKSSVRCVYNYRCQMHTSLSTKINLMRLTNTIDCWDVKENWRELVHNFFWNYSVPTRCHSLLFIIPQRKLIKVYLKWVEHAKSLVKQLTLDHICILPIQRPAVSFDKLPISIAVTMDDSFSQSHVFIRMSN